MGDPRVRPCVAGIRRNSVLKILKRLRHAVKVTLVPVKPGSQEKEVRIDMARTPVLMQFWRASDRLGDLARNFILDGENVLQAASKLARPDLVPRGHIV